MSSILSYFKTLVIGGRGGASLARTAFWLTFILALWQWGHGRDIPGFQMAMLESFLGYTLYGKTIGAVKEIKEKRRTIKSGDSSLETAEKSL